MQRWRADGVIDPSTADVLTSRYAPADFSIGLILRYLGIVGAGTIALGLGSAVLLAAESLTFAAFVCSGLSAGMIMLGLKMARDPEGRYPHSSKSMIAGGYAAVGGSVGLWVAALGLTPEVGLMLTGPLVVGGGFILAYSTRILLVLVLTLMSFFSWIGSWHRMLGRSTYAFDIQDPKAMAVVAIAVVAFGLWHERRLGDRFPRFHLAYQSLGCLYLNMALLILSLSHHFGIEMERTTWVMALTVTALLQIVMGAAARNNLLVGFGVTFTWINLYTRYFETYWDKWSAWLFFFAGGALLLGASVGLEILLKRLTPRTAHAR